jgi:hypothetical protein
MKAGRFERWAKARKLHARIVGHLSGGGSVMVATMTRATVFGPKHVESFRCDRTGVYARYGKRWDCIDYCGIRFSK